MYGYQIAKRLERFGDGVLSGKQSALYPVLRNLGSSGLLDSHVEPSMSGPPRRYYRITAAGRAVLHEWSAAWRATRDSVDAVLREPEPRPPSFQPLCPNTSPNSPSPWPATEARRGGKQVV